jgi:hypothetical protein
MRLGFDLSVSSVGNVGLTNLRLGWALRWKAEDHQLGRSESMMW